MNGKIKSAEERDDQVTATVEFSDGLEQTVIVPSWATRDQVLLAAKQARAKAERANDDRVKRDDLVTDEFR